MPRHRSGTNLESVGVVPVAHCREVQRVAPGELALELNSFFNATGDLVTVRPIFQSFKLFQKELHEPRLLHDGAVMKRVVVVPRSTDFDLTHVDVGEVEQSGKLGHFDLDVESFESVVAHHAIVHGLFLREAFDELVQRWCVGYVPVNNVKEQCMGWGGNGAAELRKHSAYF